MQKFYYTFGSDEHYPYSGGYVVIEAADIKVAHTIFRAYFPDRTPGVLNCADYYDEAAFARTGMAEGGNRGLGVQKYIDAREGLAAFFSFANGTETVRRVSIDNGNRFVYPEEALAYMNLDAMVPYMDDDAAADAAQTFAPCSDLVYLVAYLNRAPADLIIG